MTDIPTPRDMARALALLFADWWAMQQEALKRDTGIGISFTTMCKSGFFDSAGSWGPTELGKRALALAEEALDALDRLTAELTRLREQQQWRPIESAPKDRWIIVLTNAVQDLPAFTTVCRWHEDAGFCVDELREPTHWQPLPDPPEPK